jgi:hypothetical protein
VGGIHSESWRSRSLITSATISGAEGLGRFRAPGARASSRRWTGGLIRSRHRPVEAASRTTRVPRPAGLQSSRAGELDLSLIRTDRRDGALRGSG